MDNILIFDTVIGTSNLGDQIIYDSLYEQMEPLFDEAFILRYGTHVVNFTPYLYARMRSKRKGIERCKYKFIMGTNLLSYDLLETRRQWMVGPLSHGIYKGVIMAGVGTTQKEKQIGLYTKLLYKSILNQEFIHSVRDDQSVKLLEDIGVRSLNTGCPTLWKLTPDFCAGIPTKKADNVVFSLSGFVSQRDREKDQLILNVLEKNYDKLYFWCQTLADEDYLRSLKMTKPVQVVYSLKKYSQLLSCKNLDYVGTRLHGGVFALQHQVRALVISIDHRARGFHESNNLPIIERDEIEGLEDIINAGIRTEIRLNEKNINEWKAQFGL